jgi:hypothetical protein
MISRSRRDNVANFLTIAKNLTAAVVDVKGAAVTNALHCRYTQSSPTLRIIRR